MSSFTEGTLVTVAANDKETLYIILTPFRYYLASQVWEDLEGGYVTEYIEISEGFITDFATSPRWAWAIVPPRGRYSKACVIHDALLKGTPVKRQIKAGLIRGTSTINEERRVGRSEADAIFYEAMGVLKVKQWRRVIMFVGVSLRTFALTIKELISRA